MKFLILIIAIEIIRCFSQTQPAEYSTHDYKNQFASHFRQPYSTVVVTGEQGADYFSTLYAYPQYPQLLTPCNHMYPLSILIGNTKSTSEFSVEFSCNTDFLRDSVILRSTYYDLKINSTAILEGACTYFASYLNMATSSVFQTNSFVNITYLIPASIVSHTLSLIPTPNAILGTIPKINWINRHFYGRRTYDLPNFLNLAADFDGTFTLPINYKIFLPDDVLPGVTVKGDQSSRLFLDQFNITLTHGNYSTQNGVSSTIESSKMYISSDLSGYLPIVIPTMAISPITIYQDWKKDENKMVPWWGVSNIPIGFSPLRILPPSNLPKSTSNSYGNISECKSNFEFYYPKPIDSSYNHSNFRESLELLKNSSGTDNYFLNTLQGTFFFNKLPYSPGKDVDNQLINVIPPYKFLDTNFIGGCFYNGTFPLVSDEFGIGFKAGSLCYVDSTETYPTSNSPFYPPPLKYSGFLTQPEHMVGIITSISQFVRYEVDGKSSQNFPANLKPYNLKYPGIGISQSIIYSTYHAGPRFLVTAPFNVYQNSDIDISFNYYSLGEPYVLRMFGQYGNSGTSMSCRSPRFVPRSQDVEGIQVNWLCFKPKKTVTQQQAATEIKNSVTESCKIDDTKVEACSTNEITSKTWSLNLPNNAYDKTKIAMIVQNVTDTNFPKTFKSYSKAGSWFRITVLNDNPYEETWYPHSFCNVLPILPIVPISTPQIIKLSSTIQPWDHFQDSTYSRYISTNGNTSISVEVSLESDTSLPTSTQIYLTSFALCQNLQTIQLKVFPDKITLSNINMYGSIPVTAVIPPIGINLRNNVDCYINFYASFNQPYTSRIGTFSSFGGAAPASPVSGTTMFSYYVVVDTPPYVGTINTFPPDPSKSVLTDAIFLSVEKIIYQSESQSGVFPTVGIIASSSIILNSNSTVLLLGDSLQSLPQTIRLPSTSKIWYIYFRAQTFSNSGCSIPCSSELKLKSSFFAHWCTSGSTEAQICPKQAINMSDSDSEDVVMDAIATSLNQITYYSLNEAFQLLTGLFYQPITQKLVWKDYFKLLYDKVLDPQLQVPYTLDFSASRLQQLFILKRILQVAKETPLEVDTLSPISILPNATLNAECSNNIGTKYLLLDVIDLLLFINTQIGSTLNPSAELMSTLLRGIESVANRFSFWNNGPNDSFSYIGEHSKTEVNIKSTSFFSAYSGIELGSFKFKYLTKLDFRELNLVDSYYMRINQKYYYNPKEVVSNCTNSVFTLSSTLIESNRLYSSLYNIAQMNLSSLLFEPGVYIGSSALMWCSVDYHAYNMLQQVEFSFEIPTKNELDLTRMLCAANINKSWEASSCRTTYTISGQNSKEITRFQCSCNAISDYALVGIPKLVRYSNPDGAYDPFSPSINKPWGGFDNSLESLGSNETQIFEIINSSYSGFVAIFEEVDGLSAEKVDFSILGNSKGLRGTYTQIGREEKNSFGIEWGINETQKLYNMSNTKKMHSMNSNYLLWGHTQNSTSQNNTIIGNTFLP
ncbi:hypothetical protein FG386_000517 [Cryptosporidium ryanae]|uniref:uncharacterized protein n=1 Tax=Cryptosporidium ryanae TaxID=515981 RepID=UPI00351A5E97|nr:hypothetical protein FG386_000517 [Cryptosporidium ryanae]